MKINNTYYPTSRNEASWSLGAICALNCRSRRIDRILVIVKVAVIVFGLVGSAWGICRCAEYRAEARAFEAAHPDLMSEGVTK